MRALVAVPLVLILVVGGAWIVYAAAGWNVPAHEILIAAATCLISGELAMAPLLLSGRDSQLAVSQAALVGTMVQLLAGVALAAVAGKAANGIHNLLLGADESHLLYIASSINQPPDLYVSAADGSGRASAGLVTIGASGVGETQWRVPQGAPMGDYALQFVRPHVKTGEDDTVEEDVIWANQTIKVDEYKLPTMKASVSGPKGALTSRM